MKTGKSLGIFSGNTPEDAANKAFTRFCHLNQNCDKYTFIIKEFKNGKPGKIYYFTGSMVNLERHIILLARW
ncbi:hypothetical protein QJ854_gp934 [Moumouvirus goulette]|uniref:Uncharacterized protein n=1 Tax=Moumouvirus goulette TaxID=1247379 RepID=M1PFS5_9VIRU|nr:hypothetical protein QJ854_gp934 [Moumouvirus goulette]AGF84848.1 hypothetical protein glt_00039 [Moumouvirus goulette]